MSSHANGFTYVFLFEYGFLFAFEFAWYDECRKHASNAKVVCADRGVILDGENAIYLGQFDHGRGLVCLSTLR